MNKAFFSWCKCVQENHNSSTVWLIAIKCWEKHRHLPFTLYVRNPLAQAQDGDKNQNKWQESKLWAAPLVQLEIRCLWLICIYWIFHVCMAASTCCSTGFLLQIDSKQPHTTRATCLCSSQQCHMTLYKGWTCSFSYRIREAHCKGYMKTTKTLFVAEIYW